MRRVVALSILVFCLITSVPASVPNSIPIYGATPAPNSKEEKITPPRIDQLNYPVLYLQQPCLEGEAIWLVQARLREIGYDIQPDGVYNALTSNYIRMFQLAHGMKDDGVVTPEVWKTLMEVEPARPCMSDNKPQDRFLIVIDVKTRTLVFYQNDKEIRRYPVAVGKSETPTPLGEWNVVHKGVGWGNGFGTRWMGLNVPWGIYGIHGTDKPYSIGTYASHGCIRMFNRDVEKLYPLVPHGTPVRIVENGKMFPENLKPVALKKGSSGQRVVYVQSRLKELGIELDRADGRYGTMTELAVKYYQVWHNLEPSGEMNEDTYRAMGMIRE